MNRPTRARKFSDYFFTYSWTELAVVRHLRDTMVFFYVSIAIIGYILDLLGDSGKSAIVSAALAMYPGYLLGLLSQRRQNPAALESEELMIWQIGNVAKVFSLAGALLLVRHLVAD